MPRNAENILHHCLRHMATPVREPVCPHSARGPHALSHHWLRARSSASVPAGMAEVASRSAWWCAVGVGRDSCSSRSERIKCWRGGWITAAGSGAAPVSELAQVGGVRLVGQAAVPGQEPGERQAPGIGEHRLDRGERSQGHRDGHLGATSLAGPRSWSRTCRQPTPGPTGSRPRQKGMPAAVPANRRRKWHPIFQLLF